MANVRRLPAPIAEVWDWQRLGACRGRDSAQFFHPDGERGSSRDRRERAAKALCLSCPVRAECAAHALAAREPYGVWGGLTEAERVRLLDAGWEDAADYRLAWVDLRRLEAKLAAMATHGSRRASSTHESRRASSARRSPRPRGMALDRPSWYGASRSSPG